MKNTDGAIQEGPSRGGRGFFGSDWIYILLGLAFLIFFFHKIIFLGQTYFMRDTMMQFAPWKAFAARSLQNGHIPLWNPYTYCGMPFMANMQSAVFYPPGILFYLFSFVTAYKLYILLHIFAAWFFMYLLMKDFAVSRSAAFLAGIVFAFNGYMMTRLEFLSVLGVSVWLPLALLLLRRFSRVRFSVKNCVFLGAVLAVGFLAGHPQVFIYSCLVLFAYALGFYFIHKKTSALYVFFISGIFAACAAAVQLIPSIEFVLNSARGSGLDYGISTVSSLPFDRIAGMFLPWVNFSYTPDMWPYACYAGALPLLLLLFNAAGRKRNYFFLAVFGLSVLWALGGHNPLFRPFFKIFPPIRAFRYPATALFMGVFAAAALAGLGLDMAVRRRWLAAAVIVAAMLDLYAASGLFNRTLEDSIFTSYGAGTYFLASRKGLYRIFPTPKTVGQMTGRGRNAFAGWKDVKDNMYGDINMDHGIFSARGQDLHVASYRRFLRKVDSMGSAHAANKLLSLMNVRYLLAPDAINSPEYSLAKKGSMRIYENKNSMPRVFIAPAAKVMDREKILDYMAVPEFAPGKLVVLEKKIQAVPGGAPREGQKSSASITDYTPDSVTVKVKAAAGGWLFLSDVFYPGWKAYADGKKTEIYRADYTFRAVRVAPDVHTVKFIYKPASYSWGKAVSALSLASFIVLLLMRKRKKPSGFGQTAVSGFTEVT